MYRFYVVLNVHILTSRYTGWTQSTVFSSAVCTDGLYMFINYLHGSANTFEWTGTSMATGTLRLQLRCPIKNDKGANL